MVNNYDGAIDRGLEGVIACTTKISYIIDATLTYRGYTIEDLSAHSHFEEVVFLLWNNRLPKEEELKHFSKKIHSELTLSKDQLKVLADLPSRGVHPMAWLRTAVSMLSLWDEDAPKTDDRSREKVMLRLLAKTSSLVPFLERIRNGKEYIEPMADKSLAWNFLYTMNGVEPEEEVVKVFDTCLVLHADHELNCSTFASRVISSSLSDIYSSVVSAISALKGPLHGGANEQVMKTLKSIGSLDKVDAWVHQVLAEKKKIMGIGHRVYKNGDPRAKILKEMSRSLCAKNGKEEYFKMSERIEEIIKSEKGLLPNVDFYSATVYDSMGIPFDLYTPIFTVSRIGGWLAHIQEQYSQNRIYRPRGEWKGASHREWSSFKNR